MTAPAIVTSDKTIDTARLTGPRGFIPLRAQPDAPDGNDGSRIHMVRGGWSNLDDLVRGENRQIEENVRMLAGQQNSVFHPGINKYIDVSDWMTADERRWRARSIINRLLPWYIITHARATENQPIVTFVPGPDRADAELAEMLDIAIKSVWFEANMEDAHDRLMAWVIAAGRGHLLSRVDPSKGKMRPWVGDDMIPMVDEYDQPIDDGDGGQAHQMMPNVPFGPDGQPRAVAKQYSDGQIVMQQTGEPHSTPIGGITVDVLSPPQVRASWGPEPWHKKRRHYIKSFHTPEEVWEMFGVDCQPNVRGSATDVGELERLLYGTGFFGSASQHSPDSQMAASSTEGYVEITQMWEAPCAYGGLDKSGNSAGGRWLVVTPNKVLRDGVRPAAFPNTSPLNTFEFVRLPGRNGGTTTLESMIPIQRQYNALHSQLREHVNLSTNPKGVIDAGSGIQPGKFTNKPGENYVVQRRPGVPALEYVGPPQLSRDVYQAMELLRQELHDLGFMSGVNEGSQPGDSGEKVKEVRFNTDRHLGPTMRRSAGEYGRVFENWRCLMPLIWDMETAISYAGDDNIARTITVWPQMFEQGYVNVRPDVESMLPEGRGERQQQTYNMYLSGMFGLPGTPQALRKFWEMARMPHMSRAAKPGGIHTTTAEQENGQLLLGADPRSIPVYEWYDDEAHLAVHENFMASPEFKKLDPKVQDAFVLHRSAHLFNQNAKMAQAAQQQAMLNPQPQPDGNATPPPKGDQPTTPGDVRPQPAALPRGQQPTSAPTPAPTPQGP